MDLEGNETGSVATVDAEKPLRALAFKIMDDRYGALCFTRIYSGQLKKGDTVLNTASGKTERIGRIVTSTPTPGKSRYGSGRGHRRLARHEDYQTGHTLCDVNKPATLEPMNFRSCDLHRHRADGQGRRGQARHGPVEDDRGPSFRVETDEESGKRSSRAWVSFIDIKVDILKRTHASTSPSVSLRWPTGKRSPRRFLIPTPTKSKPGVRGSSLRLTTPWSLGK